MQLYLKCKQPNKNQINLHHVYVWQTINSVSIGV